MLCVSEIIYYSLHVCWREVKNSLFPSVTLIYGTCRDDSKNYNIRTWEHKTRGQFRLWARATINVALMLSSVTINQVTKIVMNSGSPLGCSAKRLFLSYVLPSTYMVPLGDWSPQKKFQHYRPINGFGMAIWSFDLFYNVKTAEIGAKIFND